MATTAIAKEIRPIVAKLKGLCHHKDVQRAMSETQTGEVRHLIEQLSEKVSRAVNQDLEEAKEIAKIVRSLSEFADDNYCRAHAFRATSHVEFTRGRFLVAQKEYEKALAIFESCGPDTEVVRTLNSALQTLICLGQYLRALA